jgi:ATP-binding cassette subfamily C protein CydCD
MHRRLIQLAQTARLPLSIGIAGGLIAGLCGVAQAYLLSATVDRAFLGRSGLAGVWPWLHLLLGVIAVRGLFLWMQELAASEVAIRVKQQLRERLFLHIVDLGPSFSRGQKTGALTTAAVDGIESLDAYYGQYLPQLVISAAVPLTILAVVFPLDPLSGLILLLTAPLIPFFMYMIGRSAEQATGRQYDTLGRLSSHLLDSIQGLATLKIFGQSEAQTANIAVVADRFRDATLKVMQVSFLSAFALELIATISTAIIAVTVGLRLLYGNMAFQPALFMLILAPEFYMPLRMLGARFHAGMTGTAAARRIFEVIDTPLPVRAEAGAAQKQIPSGVAQTDGPPAFGFRDVGYTYPGREHPALHHIDLDIPPRIHIAIVGASGAGKSTLAALILGFMAPTTGRLRVGTGNLDAAATRPPGLRIGWMPQAPHLFHSTIADNIKLGRPDASKDEVRQAARLAHLDAFIATLPMGLETVVGEGAARLSSGEAQRLALARAFLLDAPVLVLDEPSSSLDPENEALLEDSLRRLGADRTVITIAHRLTTVERSDQIIVLDRGRIIERGNHAELVAAGGHYLRLLRAGWDGTAAPDPPEIRAETPAPHRSSAGVGGEWGQHELPVPAVDRRAVLTRLLGFMDGFRGRVALSVLLATLTIASSVALLGTSAWLISAAALHPSIAALQVAIVGVRLFGISRAVFRYFERLVSHDVTFRLLRNIRVWFYAHLEPLAPARLMDYHAGDLVNRAIADVDTLENLYVRVLSPVLTAVVFGAAVSAFLWSMRAPELALVLVMGFTMVGLVLPMLSVRGASQPGRSMIAQRSHLRAQLVDGIQGLADIIAFGRQADWSASVGRTGKQYATAQRSMARVTALQAASSSVFIHLTMWFALVLWIPRATDGLRGLLLAPFALIVLSSFEAVSGLAQAGQLWPATVAAARRLFEIVRVPAAVREGHAESVWATAPQPPTDPKTPTLEFRGVNFQYPGRSQPALQEITFTLAPGEHVAVVGPSGAGKSTLAQLLLRFWEYNGGDILLWGRSLRSMTGDQARSQIGFASQRPYIYDTTILENLRLARRGLSEADLEYAADQAGIHAFIQALPRGYDTLIGEHGASLSAGERQRLGLARLILKAAPVLVMDEPTANLDAMTEAQTLDRLFILALGRSCLFITHRLRRLEHFDRILVMDHGVIREQGSHDSLLAAGGMYARLWNLQYDTQGSRVSWLANGN